ncbi:FAD-binding domain-containing protein [Dothidotthia symphoricarpi CBS 119687]|uniref:FAD-binding domain-containing protein n=1 Tax=Dothidotthia symphoricarpi CBS 119687 TaxID=1392245 RepID=A0A6A6AKI1_9PLEO|nr:FAD-binding domain-containing protein [Dothidotthia symphoricarpi CBS 119687]KAF2132459.1 FAD-binding domain-containing protein [Dothidotthia symphoricarpi CBS 119687]
MYSSLFLTLISIPTLFTLSAVALPQDPSALTGADSKGLLTCIEKALGSNSANRIITPSSDQYLSARTGAVLVDQFPALVVYVNKLNEISPLVKCGVANGFKIAPRSGAHNFENWSALTGSLVIDISNMNYILPSKDLNTATVGGGTRLGALYSVLGTYGTTFAGGICPSVGVGGYLNAGGYNMQMRTKGLAVDHIESARIILANGDLVDVSATSNADLWYAIRGGGTFGITAEVVVKTENLPRSAMFSMNFGRETRLEVMQKFQDWASRQDPLFNSQLNLYSDRINVLGWYLGKSKDELSAIVATSGFLDVAGGDIKISGNCSTANSRNYWLYLQDTCTDDATADDIFLSMHNTAPDALTPVQTNGLVNALSQVPALPNVARATRWSRANIKVKTLFEMNDKPLSPADVKWLIDETGKLSMDVGFWAEITTFNISAKATTSAFPWQGRAKTLFRLQVNNGLTDNAVQAEADDFIKSVETYLRPKIGDASYAGYVDKDISVNPYKAYYGDSVCRLVRAKKEFDPANIFSNPFSVGPTAPQGYTC